MMVGNEKKRRNIKKWMITKEWWKTFCVHKLKLRLDMEQKQLITLTITETCFD